MIRVGKGFSGVETPLFEEDVVDDVAEDVAHVATPSPPPHGIPFPPQELSLPPQQPYVIPPAPIQARVKKLEQTNKVKSSKLRRLRKVGTSRQVESSNDMEDVFNQGRMMNEDEGIELVKDAKIAKSEGRQADKQTKIYNIDLDYSSKFLIMQEDDSEVQEVVEVVTIAKLITKVVTAVASQLSLPTQEGEKGVTIRDPKEELPLKTPAETPKVKDKGNGILVEAPKPIKKKDQIEMDAEYARKLQEEIDRDHDGFNKDIDWDAAMDHNTAGYKMDFCKGMTYAQICPIFQAMFDENIRFLFKPRAEMEAEDQEIIKSINETPAQKATKRRKLSEEAQEAKDLRKRLEVVEDEDDDVFVEATPLVSKVPIVDYQIVLIDNKPRTCLQQLAAATYSASVVDNTAGYKMDFCKGMTYAQICPIFQAMFDENIRFLFKPRAEMEAEDQEIIKSINETPVQKATKRRKLSEEAQEAKDLRKRLEVVEDEDADVFVEATPLVSKVPIVDYQIVLIDNKPRYKIIRADDTHQLYISFTTLLKNFNREDLETL
nr:hypothetical protein [Tanacetum cinerariifolium]